MAIQFLLPRLGETMEEGTIIQWLRKPGERVQRGQPLLVVETDKATVEVPSYANGILSAILKAEGETVPVNTPIAVIDEDTESPHE
ncbi:MAG: hypothetical protein NTU62_12530 [Spirochaetes bacterium]|nr:hypothetical protein [Spirochaetota bacterium]